MTYNSIRDDGQYEDKLQCMSERDKTTYLASETKALLGNSPALVRTKTLSLETLSETFLDEHVIRVFK